MKKIFSLLSILTLFSVFLFTTKAYAQETCDANVLIHYHRHDNTYDEYEAYTWDNGGDVGTAAFSETDSFGAIANMPVCSTAADEIGLILKIKDSWDYKDGIDVNQDDDIENKLIDVSDIVGTTNTKEVYVMQGSNYVYYQDPDAATYFGKPGFGNVVVVYYNPTGNEGWDDLWTWDTGTDAKSDDVNFDYKLGIDQGTDPDLFNVAVINIANDAEDQIGLIMRKDKSWDIKDDQWAGELAETETDENGHTYSPDGNRLINVTDVQGIGFKFIYVINGVKTLYEDFNLFTAEAFKLEFTQAEFRTVRTLGITLNQALSYGQAGPDKSMFQVKDQDGNIIPIHKITYNSLTTSGKTFNIIINEDITQDNTYTITYNYEQFGEQKSATTETTFATDLFQAQNLEDDVTDTTTNYLGYIIAGVVVLAIAGVGLVLLYRNRR